MKTSLDTRRLAKTNNENDIAGVLYLIKFKTSLSELSRGSQHGTCGSVKRESNWKTSRRTTVALANRLEMKKSTRKAQRGQLSDCCNVEKKVDKMKIIRTDDAVEIKLKSFYQ